MEDIIKQVKKYNIEHNILPRENVVIDRILERSTEMREVYRELSEKLTRTQQEFFWDAILGAASFWNYESSKELREQRRQLIALNDEISKEARKLANLIDKRYKLSEASGFHSHEDSHVVNWIERAAVNNYMYQGYVQNKVRRLSAQYDSKYWPRTQDIVSAIADFAEEADVLITNEWTEELLASRKSSKADHVRVLFRAIADRKKPVSGPITHVLPATFYLKDRSMATLINCTLDLQAEELVTAEYVKRTRQRIREQQADCLDIGT